MKMFRACDGREYRLLESKHCERHGRYPARGRERFGEGLYSREVVSWIGCPACAAEKREAALYDSANIPPRFRYKTLSAYVPCTQAMNLWTYMLECVAHLDEMISAGRSTLICGNPGTGKTHLACALLIAAVKANRTAWYTTIRDLIVAVRSTWGKTAEATEAEVVTRLCSYDVLVIDEVGVQSGSDNERAILFSVINGRYNNLKPTILISNETPKTVRWVIGDRAYDRLRENSGGAFNCEWTSYRPNAKQGTCPDQRNAVGTFYEIPDEEYPMREWDDLSDLESRISTSDDKGGNK